ncbi:hypothetical protein GCK32_021708, partial [Trichostrongylus colubriformis]
MEVLNKLQQQTGNLLTDWKRAESHANKKQDDGESSSLLQEFQNHWESINCESQLSIARIDISFMERAIDEVQAVQAKEQQRKDESEHPAPIPCHLIETPKLELPKFAGDITLFPEFWEIFSAAIHNHPYMTEATKLIYLKGALQGDAKDIVASVQVGDDNYSKAVELLRNTYNRPELLRNRLVEQLESLPPANESPLVQRITLCKVKAIWVQLINLNEQPGSTMTMKTIRSKFPQKTREKITLRNRQNGQPTKLHLWTKAYITKVPAIGGENDEEHVVDDEGFEEIDILIGMDHYWDVVEFNSGYQLPSGLVKSYTKLGPVLSGRKSSSITRSYTTSESIESEENNTNRMINDLFGLEAVGTQDDADDSENSIIQHYYGTVK